MIPGRQGIFAARSSTLIKLASLRNCSFAKDNCLKSGCQLPSVALNDEEVIKKEDGYSPALLLLIARAPLACLVYYGLLIIFGCFLGNYPLMNDLF